VCISINGIKYPQFRKNASLYHEKPEFFLPFDAFLRVLRHFRDGKGIFRRPPPDAERKQSVRQKKAANPVRNSSTARLS
jgi:hypothetical protein